MLKDNKLLAAGLALASVLLLSLGIGVGLLIAGDDSDSNPSPTGEANKAYVGLTVSFQARSDLLVVSVESGGPADQAGIEAGDRIRSVNGRVVRTPEQLRAAIESQEPGDLVTITYERGDAELQAQGRLGEAPPGARIEAEDPEDLQARDTPLTDLPEGLLGVLRQRLEELIERGELSRGEVQRALQGQSSGLQVGTVAAASADSLTIITLAGDELTIAITDQTSIVRHGENISASDIEHGETVMILSLDGGESALGIYVFGALPLVP